MTTQPGSRLFLNHDAQSAAQTTRFRLRSELPLCFRNGQISQPWHHILIQVGSSGEDENSGWSISVRRWAKSSRCQLEGGGEEQKNQKEEEERKDLEVDIHAAKATVY